MDQFNQQLWQLGQIQNQQAMQDQFFMGSQLQNVPYQLQNVRHVEFDAPGGDVYNVGEDRIDVPYKQWQEWQRFRQAPWWKRLFFKLT